MTGVRAAARATGAFAVRRSGLPVLVRHTIARRRATILTYHDPPPDVLERHLRYLSRRYTFVDLNLLVACLHHESWHEIPPRPLVLTFDDGHAGNAELLPLLERYGVRPTIYLCSQLVGTTRHFWWTYANGDLEELKRLPDEERRARLAARTRFDRLAEHELPQALSRDQLAALAEHADLQSHTRFHPILTMLDAAECRREIELCRLEVERMLGRPCIHFAYPNGDYGPRELALVREAGYLSARTIDAGWNGPHQDPYRLKVLGVSDRASVDQLAASLSGALLVKQALRPRRHLSARTAPGSTFGGGERDRRPRRLRRCGSSSPRATGSPTAWAATPASPPTPPPASPHAATR